MWHGKKDLQVYFFSDDLQPDEISVVNILTTGSNSEGVSIPGMISKRREGLVFGHDIDLMYVLNINKVFDMEMTTHLNDPDIHQGYCQVRFRKRNRKDAKTQDLGKKDLQKSLTNMLGEVKEIKVVATSENSAAVPLEYRVPTVDDVLNIDAASAIAISWPKEADQWSKRCRKYGWPSQSIIRQIIAEGCHLVPKAHPKSKTPLKEWRFSFSQAEKKLASHLTEAQRICYLALKVVHHIVFGGTAGLATYMLKTTLFWTIESMPKHIWKTENLGYTFILMLERILHSLCENRVSNYFIPGNNMLDHVPQGFISTWTEKLLQVRKNPMFYLLEFHRFFRPTTSLTYYLSNNIQEALKMVVEYSVPTNYEDKDLFRGALIIIAVQYAAEGKFIDLFTVCKRYANIDSANRDDSKELLCAFMRAILDYLSWSSDQTVTYCLVLANTGRLHHEVSKLSSNTASERKEHARKADLCLKQAASKPNADIYVKVTYANYLYLEGRYDESIQLLLGILNESMTRKTACSFIIFNRFTEDTTDATLREEYKVRNEIEYKTETFIFYLLVHCYVDQNLMEDAQVAMEKLIDWLDENPDIMIDNDTCILIGYCHMLLKEYKQALIYFMLAEEEGLKSATPNRIHCQQMLQTNPNI